MGKVRTVSIPRTAAKSVSASMIRHATVSLGGCSFWPTSLLQYKDPIQLFENTVAEHVLIARERRGHGKPLSGRVGIF